MARYRSLAARLKRLEGIDPPGREPCIEDLQLAIANMTPAARAALETQAYAELRQWHRERGLP